MLTVLSVLVFGSAFAVSIYALADTLAPAMPQIRRALAGAPPLRFAPLAQLVRAERRIAVRRWAATSARSSAGWREAA